MEIKISQKDHNADVDQERWLTFQQNLNKADF